MPALLFAFEPLSPFGRIKESIMPAPFTILGLDHIVLRAADPAALERFYLEVLGLSFELRQGKLTQLRAGRTLIDIVPADDAGPAGGTSVTGGANLDHLCLRIEPFDAATIAQHLAAHGIACGEEKSRYGAEGRGPSVYLNDPEGNGVELKGPVVRP
jgi:glyoxylase I family protein